MAVTLLATEVPIPTLSSGFLRLLDGYNTTGNAPTAKSLASGDFAGGASAKLNRNACGLDLGVRYGSGFYGVGYGLGLGVGTGLALAVGAGHALIDGVVEVPAATTLTVPDASARVHVWLQRDGTLTYKNNVLTPPTNPAAYIGSCVTAAGAITSVDSSGVLYDLGGVPVRYTADALAPLDSPGADPFWTVTLGGTYFWNGSAYCEVGAPGGSRIVKVTKLYSDFATAGTTNTINLFSLPANGKVRSVHIKHSASFTGGGITAYTVSVGIVGTLAKYAAAFDVFAAPGSGQDTNTQGLESYSGATWLVATATSTTANLDQATAGSVDVWVEYSVLP